MDLDSLSGVNMITNRENNLEGNQANEVDLCLVWCLSLPFLF